MPNTKPIGVAYSDPALDQVTAVTLDVSNYAAANQFICSSNTGPVVQNIIAGLYFLSSAITANVTTTTAPKGSIGTTSNATGAGKMFISDGAKWQLAVVV